MELIQRYQLARDASSGSGFNNLNSSWIAQHKKTLLIVAGGLIAVLVFLGGFFAGDAYRHTNDEVESVLPPAPRTVLPAIKWDGVCPQKSAKCPKNFQGTPPLILVSLDGFHPDYLKRGFTPTINKIAQCGANADFLYPVFPSKTFPNHYSIVTGLNPPSHGIIDNNMYDPFKRKLFKVGSPDMNEPYWYEKDSIWVTAEKQGKRTASFFWPGSEVKISGITPTYNKKYKSKLSFDVRVDQILEWLDLPPSQRPSFLTLYVNQPDNAAHWYGTKSQQVNQALSNVDQMITRLFAGLQVRNITDCVNVIILSDHGMSDIDCKLVVDIKNYMNVSDVFSTMGPFGRLRPRGRRNTTAVEDIVSKLKCQSEHMRVYPKEQLPVRMHYADNARIEPIFLDMDSSWTVVSKGVKPGDEICTGGAHGYDNLFPDMRAIFLAHGPSIKRNVSTRPFINTEIYEFMTELIDIVPNPNNGTRGSLHHIMRNPRTVESQYEPAHPSIASVPADEYEYNYRIYAANCSCTQNQKQKNIENKAEKNSEHVPFGIPYCKEDNNTLRLLYNEDYLLAFDLKYRIPMWTSFTLDGKRDASKLEDICWTGDARIPISDAAKCGDYLKPVVQKQSILQRPLFPTGFSDSSTKEQAAYVTNAIPKSVNHSRVIEKKLNEILSKWAAQEGQINVMMGPAFDLLATGVRPDIGKIMRTHENYGPLVVPTHIFVVTTWCSEKVNKIKECKPSKLETLGMLLPNKPFAQNCESGIDMIKRNVARVVDIEKLTGLSFYTGLPIYDAIRLRTMMPSRVIS
ncbi:venom phosphodiesterase 1 [Trichonephila clavata]|uniref:Venom phosphodiesterase 1 n=1 Tax=Trichonephila clavata TaxID=2740835 RepID=A0A8X6FAT2_TRICU|nr:venom phosphodiesterase 1 [Trichonephila clavata]